MFVQQLRRSANLPCFYRQLGVRHLKNQWAVEVESGLGTDILDTVLPVLAEMVEAQAILIGVDQVDQPLFERGPLCRLKFDFEQRILYPLAIVATGFGDPAQAPFARSTARAHRHG